MTTATVVGFAATVLALLLFVLVSLVQLRRVDRVADGKLSVGDPGSPRDPGSRTGHEHDAATERDDRPGR